MQDDQQVKAEVDDDDRLFSVNDLAAYLSCSRSHAVNLVAAGTIRSFKLGHLRRIRKRDIDAYVTCQLAAKD